MKLRFSIRDLLWLTALCAVLVAWWIEHRRSAELSGYLEAYKVRPLDRPVMDSFAYPIWQPNLKAENPAHR
jgi:hypothetical protein